jgi:hypothetical protein
MTKEGRVNSAGTQIMDLYRSARARAMGRGSAVLVRWDEDAAMPTAVNPAGQLEGQPTSGLNREGVVVAGRRHL